MSDASLETLVAALAEARARAESVGGRPVVGVRAVEPAGGRRWYLCALEAAGVVCLDAGFEVEHDARRLHQAVMCALLVEHAESLLQDGELDVLASAASALAEHVEAAEPRQALAAVRDGVRELAGWRRAPERAVASLPQLEVAIRLHDAVHRQYERYVEATEPLVAIQDRLADELVSALRDLEEAAGRAGILRPLAGVLAEAMAGLDAGADEIVAKAVPTSGGDAAP